MTPQRSTPRFPWPWSVHQSAILPRRLPTRPLCALLVLIAISATPQLVRAADESDARSPGAASPASFFTDDALGYLELSGLESVITRVRDSGELQNLLDSEQFKQVRETPQFRKADAVRQLVEAQLGMDLWTVANRLLGNRLAVAVYPGENRKQPDFVGFVRVKEAATFDDLWKRLKPVLVLSDRPFEVATTADGVALVTIEDEVFLAQDKNWLAVSNNRKRLDATLALLAGKGTNSLARSENFAQMTRQLGEEHEVRVFVNLAAIANATNERLGAPAKMDNPLGSLLFGGIVEMAVHSPYFGTTLDIDIDDRQLVLASGVGGKKEALGESFEPFFASAPESGTRPIPQVPDLIGGFTLFRDFPEWYARREELLQEQVLPGFDKFETGLANLLPGKNFGADVMPLIGNNFTFLAARQDYEHLDGKPGLQLPGFAVIIELAKPEEGEEVFQLFFQTISSVLNLQAGQQGRQAWLLESHLHNDVEIRYGRYLQKPKGDRLPFVFNFMPASARVGDRYVVSSSIDLCKKLVDAIRKPESNQVVDKNMSLEFSFKPIADLLEVNQEFFQAQRIQQGATEERAKEDISLILHYLRSVKSLNLDSTVDKEGLRIQLKGVFQ